MNIPSRQFSNELVKIIQHIADSHFVALDLEFSGISSRRSHVGKSRSSLQQVYEEVKEAAKQYQVLQVGLTIAEEDAQKGTCPRLRERMAHGQQLTTKRSIRSSTKQKLI